MIVRSAYITIPNNYLSIVAGFLAEISLTFDMAILIFRHRAIMAGVETMATILSVMPERWVRIISPAMRMLICSLLSCR
jgi:hypothetical protein